MKETVLEPATACLEGRWLQFRRSLDLHRPDSRFHGIHLHCERVWQKMSHAIFSPFGKTCHVVLALNLAKDVAHILRQEITLLDTLYRNFLSLAMVSRKYVLPFVVVPCLCMDIRGSQDGLK
jgi:hypothetical protein